MMNAEQFKEWALGFLSRAKHRGSQSEWRVNAAADITNIIDDVKTHDAHVAELMQKQYDLALQSETMDKELATYLWTRFEEPTE